MVGIIGVVGGAIVLAMFIIVSIRLDRIEARLEALGNEISGCQIKKSVTGKKGGSSGR